ncbi:MAG: helix-turn-helix domain-containing protein [Clostridiaceae bacterium]
MAKKTNVKNNEKALKCKEILTVDETAELLQLRRETILRYITKGEIVATKIGRPWRIRKSDLNNFLIRNENVNQEIRG